MIMRYFGSIAHPEAGMAELADAADSKSADRKVVGVRPPLPAPIKSIIYEAQASSDAFFYDQTAKFADAWRSLSGSTHS
jgi:hypothetical protein